MLGVNVDVLGAEVDAARLVHEVVHHPRLRGRVGELLDVRFPQPARGPGELAPGETIELLLSELADFCAALLELLLVRGCEDAFADRPTGAHQRAFVGADEERGGHRVGARSPQAAPVGNRRLRVLGAAVRLLEEILVVLFRRLEGLRGLFNRWHRHGLELRLRCHQQRVGGLCRGIAGDARTEQQPEAHGTDCLINFHY